VQLTNFENPFLNGPLLGIFQKRCEHVVKKYRVLFHGLRKDEEAFKTRMKSMGAPSEKLERMIRHAPVILKANLTLGSARNYADAVQDAGGKVTIQEYGFFDESAHNHLSQPFASLADFTMCPECGLKQPKGEICLRCRSRLPDA
jgi:hypothetical protein